VGSGDKFRTKSLKTKEKARQEFLFRVLLEVTTTTDGNRPRVRGKVLLLLLLQK
jgi:hypothetical protein